MTLVLVILAPIEVSEKFIVYYGSFQVYEGISFKSMPKTELNIDRNLVAEFLFLSHFLWTLTRFLIMPATVELSGKLIGTQAFLQVYDAASFKSMPKTKLK